MSTDIATAASEARSAIETVVEETSELAAEIAADAIAGAEARADAAHETAEAIADAALATRFGQMIEELRRDFNSWQEESRNRQSSLTVELEQLRQQITSLQQSPTLLVASPMEQSSSTPAISQEAVTEGLPEIVVNPASAVALAAVPIVAPAPKKARRLI